jgi:signal peptidase I
MPPSSRGKFYIKRLIGIGSDRIQIKPPHVLVNGKVLDHRRSFERIYSQVSGYSGYQDHTLDPDGRRIPARYTEYHVEQDDLFVLGDNSLHSYDGRFWGGFPRRALVGRAVTVYWPFSDRFGLID